MLFHVPDQFLDMLALVIPGALVMDIAKGPFNGVGLWAVGREEQQGEAGMRREPPLDGLGLVNAVVVYDHVDFVEARFGVLSLQTVEQGPEQDICLMGPETMDYPPSRGLQGSGQVVFVI